MIVVIGSTNRVKIDAVTEVFLDYPDFIGADFYGAKTDSQVSPQPKSMEETFKGALHRAVSAFTAAENRARENQKTGALGIGIESGLMRAPLGWSFSMGWMNFSTVVICENGNSETGIHYGFSPCFPVPNSIVNSLTEKESVDMDQAVFKAGLVDKPDIGKHQGFLGVLTGGRVTRKDYTKQAIHMALISYRNKKMFSA